MSIVNDIRCPKMGDVFFVNFKGRDSVQIGYRPAVVFQNNTGNIHSPNVLVFPLTSVIKKLSQPTHVLLKAREGGLEKDSMVLCENPVCIPKTKLCEYVTSLNETEMAEIATASMYVSC